MTDKQLVEDKILQVLTEPMANHQITDCLINDKKTNPKKLSHEEFKQKVINPALRRLAQKDKIWSIGNVQNRRHMKMKKALDFLQDQIDELHAKIRQLEHKQ